MERKNLIWGAAIVGIVALVISVPKSFSINEKVKICFNQFQWSDVDKSEKDKLDLTFWVGQEAVDHITVMNLKCSLKKLGFDSNTIGKILKPGFGTVQSGNYFFQWNSEYKCYGSFMVNCGGGKSALKVSGTFLEVKSP